MNQNDLQKAIGSFYPAIILDACVARATRETVKKTAFIFSIIFGFLSLTSFMSVTKISSPELLALISSLQKYNTTLVGLFLLSLAVWLASHMLRAFYLSYYFRGLRTILPEADLSGADTSATFEAASALHGGARRGDMLAGFFTSRFGGSVLYRLAINRADFREFLSQKKTTVPPEALMGALVATDPKISLSDIAFALPNVDAEFSQFLSARDVSPKDLSGAAGWVERTEQFFRGRERFWGKDSLGRMRGIGKDWAYGGAYTLEKFAVDVTERGSTQHGDPGEERVSEQNETEAILSRSGESNALLVADEGSGALEVVFGLGSRITRGTVLPPLEHKRIFLFDANAFIAAAKDKGQFESQLLRILNESVRAGNIILVVSDLPAFIESAKEVGSDLIGLLDPYLATPAFQMIAISNLGSFHSTLEGDSKILHHFEKIIIKDRDEASTMKILEDQALIEESGRDVFFTYQSLAAAAEGAKRYLTDGVTSDKAVHLLSEVVPAVQAKKQTVITRADIMALIGNKTGIPTGELGDGERQKLLNLETVLHERIVGQDEAVKAISNAMRRSRSDIVNPERPMGSFLFLGPTGVGKTETTKALASVFFGKEDSVIRLDMSEYRTDDALKRLIGSFEDGKAGVLSSKLREKSYGVLLLDEFEKTNKEVLDLFLQILDEGFFSDMSGRRVNARNLIIIATSNAGSDLIWNMLREGKDLAQSKDSIISEIINRGLFKPELLNRFDGVILFHPLSTENLKVIAGLMLKKLQKRLKEKGLDLVVNDALLSSVMAAGTDPQFGARPMNRAIQEKVEQVIAQKIIAGVAKPGSRIELTAEELV